LRFSDDPTSLDKDGYWVTLQSFEGEFICARFADVCESELPRKDWEKIK
jgi:para-aminobenzoate synthetase component 1